MPQQNGSLFSEARECILCRDMEDKIRRVRHLYLQRHAYSYSEERLEAQIITHPGRPDHLKFVPPQDLPRRKLNQAAGRAAMMHAIAHIEFNAVDLALDMIYRFKGPQAFYHDWLRIAREEADHFMMVRGYLNQHGFDYGDFPVHEGLWDSAVRSAGDVLDRLAVIPRGMEARGLDVSPAMVERFRQAGDEQAAEILLVIFNEEIGHVKAGSDWFDFFCKQRDLPRERTFIKILQKYQLLPLRGPLHREARKAAGFNDEELQSLDRESTGTP